MFLSLETISLFKAENWSSIDIKKKSDLSQAKAYCEKIPNFYFVIFHSPKPGYVFGSWDEWKDSFKLQWSDELIGYIYYSYFPQNVSKIEFKFYSNDDEIKNYWISDKYHNYSNNIFQNNYINFHQ